MLPFPSNTWCAGQCGALAMSPPYVSHPQPDKVGIS